MFLIDYNTLSPDSLIRTPCRLRAVTAECIKLQSLDGVEILCLESVCEVSLPSGESWFEEFIIHEPDFIEDEIDEIVTIEVTRPKSKNIVRRGDAEMIEINITNKAWVTVLTFGTARRVDGDLYYVWAYFPDKLFCNLPVTCEV